MEYRLNKIDTEIRHSINEETSEGKIHTKKGISVNKDKERDKESGQQQGSHKEETKGKINVSKYIGTNEKIMVEAVKVQNIEVQAVKEGSIKEEKNYKGSFIDIRR